MEKIELKNYTCNYSYNDHGKNITLVFSNSLGTNFSMWDDNLEFLKDHFNILRHDTRGHGKSTIEQDEVSVGELAEDVVELIDRLKLDKVVFCGLSIGGLIGQHLAVNHSDRFEKFVICNTAAKIGTHDGWNTRISQVTENGLSSILGGTALRWFSDKYREQNPDKVQAILNDFAQTSLRGYTACCAAVRDADFTNELKKVQKPTLIISGSKDEVTTVEHGNFMEAQIPNSTHISFEAAHLSNKEYPKEFAEALIDFCSDK